MFADYSKTPGPPDFADYFFIGKDLLEEYSLIRVEKPMFFIVVKILYFFLIFCVKT